MTPERNACPEKIIDFVSNFNFNTSLGKELGLSGINRVYVQFRINTYGEVEVMGCKSTKTRVGRRSETCVNLIPQMTPGKQEGQKVGVLYSLPITFRVAE